MYEFSLSQFHIRIQWRATNYSLLSFFCKLITLYLINFPIVHYNGIKLKILNFLWMILIFLLNLWNRKCPNCELTLINPKINQNPILIYSWRNIINEQNGLMLYKGSHQSTIDNQNEKTPPKKFDIKVEIINDKKIKLKYR